MTTQKIRIAIGATADEVRAALTDPTTAPASDDRFQPHDDLAAGAAYPDVNGGHQPAAAS